MPSRAPCSPADVAAEEVFVAVELSVEETSSNRP
jgi:hypothetical protein